MADVLNDRAGFGENGIAVLNDGRRRSRMQRQEFRWRQPIWATPVPLELVRKAQFLHQPHDTVGLRNAEMVDGYHRSLIQ